jgi:PPOX class probable F420-dependent enzyme
VRTDLNVEDLGNFLQESRVAVLATLRKDGSVLLSPVYHVWRDAGFNVWIWEVDVKARHLRRDPRATIVVAESEPPRGVEVRGVAQLIDGDVFETAARVMARYEGKCERGARERLAPRPTTDIPGGQAVCRVAEPRIKLVHAG